jgi:hypothetical protein
MRLDVEPASVQPRVESLRERIAALVAERRELRSREAGPEPLEGNRLAIVRAQQDLSRALIALFGEPSGGQPAA